MVLVDTSVLIGYLKNHISPAITKFETILEFNLPFGITDHIYQELLQGTKTEKEFFKLKEYLDTFTFYSILSGHDGYSSAARIYFECRRNGVTVRSTIDCLIAQTAIENRLRLLHDDRDFTEIASRFPDLLIF